MITCLKNICGEIVVYPPGAAGASHHHVGTEHLFYISEAGSPAAREAAKIGSKFQVPSSKSGVQGLNLDPQTLNFEL